MSPARLIRIRHLVQWSLLGLFVVLPFTGLVRVDTASGRFLVGGMQIWWDDFFIVFPFWAMVFLSMTAFYSNFGMIFCGWMCPQHTLSEWLNNLIRSWLGRRVLAGISPERVEGNSKRKLLGQVVAWTAFGLLVLLLSAVLTLAVLHYFFTGPQLWGHFVGGEFNLYIAAFSVMLGVFVVLDLGILRHFWCKYMCPYGLWQYMFRNRDTLQIRFDQARAEDCNRCSLCKDVCPVDLDPRQPEIYTRCINCGICIDACDSYMGRFDKGPILSFGFGTQKEQLIRIDTGRSRIWTSSVMWPVGGVLVAAMLFAYGVSSFEPTRVVVHQQGDTAQWVGQDHVDYALHMLNKAGEPHRYTVAVDGLPGGQAQVTRAIPVLAAGDKVQVAFTIRHEGLSFDRPYPFTVKVVRDDGHTARAEAVYYLPAPVDGEETGGG